MNDSDLEDLLRRVRPRGPAPELRARILDARPAPRAWPWVAAAAALLAVTVGLHQSSSRFAQTALVLHARDEDVVAVLTKMLDADPDARAHAELIVATEQSRAARNAEPSVSDWVGEYP